MHPRLRIFVAIPVVGLSFIPATVEFMGMAKVQREKQAAIASQKEDSAELIRSAEHQTQQGVALSLERAKTCLKIHTDTPIVEGAIVYYGKTTRKLPSGSTVCDLNAGKTADIASGGRAIDLQNIAPEKLKEAVYSR